jgi:hypothetical protein
LTNLRLIRFGYQSGFWRPRWFLPKTDSFQERLGGGIALGLGRGFNVYNLSFRESSDSLRLSQLKEALDDAGSYAPRETVVTGRNSISIAFASEAVS